MKAAELILNCLSAQGISTMYGVPGEENADIMMALRNHKIKFITCTHEQTSAFMAVMHGELTGTPGVCLSTLGPGATNLITGVAQATLDGAPLVALIGQGETARLHKISHQNINSIEMFRPVTKWASTILSADTIPEVIAKAFKIATSGRPGSVVIELPEDIAEQETDAAVIGKLWTQSNEQTSDAQVHKCIELLEKSKKPLLLIGDGAARTESDDAVREFLKLTKLYAAYTFMGKGVISNLYERSLHCVGLGIKDIAINAFQESDLVICIGYSMVEWSPANWNIGIPKKIIHIDTASAEIDEHYLPKLELIGSIPLIMQQVNQAVTKACEHAEPYFAEIQRRTEEDIRSFADDDSFPMKPKRILRDLRNTLGDNDILVSDVGAHKMWIARQYGARHSKTCLISNGFCSMGGAMPGAMEAKRLYRNKNVVAVCGDGGFMMSIQALFTGVAYKIPFVVCVWEDNQYGLIRWKQEMHFQNSSYIELVHKDLTDIAAAIGCHAKRIDASDQLVPTLEWALKQKEFPTVIVIPIDYHENMRLFLDLKQKS